MAPHHVFVNGMLYNAEILGAVEYSGDGMQSCNLDPDPMEETTPTIHGVRFVNPFYHSQTNGPKKPKFKRKARPEPVPYSEPPQAMANGLTHLQGHYSQLAEHRLANANVYGRQQLATAQEQLRANRLLREQQREEQELGPDEPLPPPLSVASGSPSHGGNNSRPRRKGRNRSRGFTQSFGIVVPVKQNNSVGNANMKVAKDVLSLFDRKPSTLASRKSPPPEGNRENNLPVDNNRPAT